MVNDQRLIQFLCDNPTLLTSEGRSLLRNDPKVEDNRLRARKRSQNIADGVRAVIIRKKLTFGQDDTLRQ